MHTDSGGMGENRQLPIDRSESGNIHFSRSELYGRFLQGSLATAGLAVQRDEDAQILAFGCVERRRGGGFALHCR